MAKATDVSKMLLTRGPEMGGNVLRQLLDVAVNGAGKVPGAKPAAAKALAKHGSVDAAIDSLVSTHLRLATAQGFVTNLGGVVTAIVGLPVNLAGVAVTQIRMVATIAHLRGYDIDDPRVRTAMTLCLLGESGVKTLVERGVLPTTPMAIATAPVFDASLDSLVSEQVFAEMVGRLGGRRAAVQIVRRVPLVGGGVSGVLDAWHTNSIGDYAKQQFVTRRRLSK
ncbi:EcsC family protein [Nigerium massiliense]|uniref:EcsC family protein n=1 Tax=Nigerium massiliense TaxID=1522317 RepID=UPI000590B609|nr:EcsC family protein [Nigerium massiliense]